VTDGIIASSHESLSIAQTLTDMLVIKLYGV